SFCFSSRRRHTRSKRDWSSDVCSSDLIDEEFTGIISSVTSFGLFVELENTVEGLVHVSYMDDDYYHYSETSHALIGEMSKKIYRIGDEVDIKVINVNMEEHAVDFI